MDPAGVMAYVKTLPINNDKVQQSMKEILEECKSIQDPDRWVYGTVLVISSFNVKFIVNFRCEFGSKLMECFAEGATKRGIKSGALYPQ